MTIAGRLGALASKSVQRGISKFNTMAKNIKEGEGAAGKFVKFLNRMGVVGPVVEVFKGWVDILSTAFTPIIEKLVPLMSKLTPYVAAFAEWLGKIVDFLTTVEGWKQIGEWFKDAWAGMKDWFKNSLVQWFKNAWSGFKDWVIGAITNPFKETWGGIKDWFNDNIIQPFKDAWMDFVDWIVAYMTPSASGGPSAIEKILAFAGGPVV